MTKLHHELGLITLVTITSEVIIQVPAVCSVVPVVVGPGRLQSVQVVYQRLHHLVLHELAARSLNRSWMSLPHSSGATHARTEWLHIVVLGVIEVIVVVVVILPHHLDLSLQVVPEVSIDTVSLAPLAHFSTPAKYRKPRPSLH